MGVGPVLAKKLVGHFGAEVLKVIGDNPADLESVSGIGPKRRERIANAWQESMQIREIMLFLHSHGVSTGRAVRIFKTYGNLAIQTVRENAAFSPRQLLLRFLELPFGMAHALALDWIELAVNGHMSFEAPGSGNYGPSCLLQTTEKPGVSLARLIVSDGQAQCLFLPDHDEKLPGASDPRIDQVPLEQHEVLHGQHTLDSSRRCLRVGNGTRRAYGSSMRN